ncbi:MAG TPA: glycosyltransferase [Nevskia sp.]|nr:glycosyltransferase [Nevskia sp.]
MAETRVTVVMLTHNRRAEAVRTVERLLALPERAPVIVVDNASADGTAEHLRRRYPAIRVIAQPRNRGAAGRNAGVELADTRYVAFCDDDTWWEPGSITRAAETLDRYPRVASLTARVLVGESGMEDPTCALMAASPLPSRDLPGPALLGLLAGATIFRRDAFLQVGGYQPRYFLGGEEALLALDLAAAGWSMAYLPSLCVHHHPSSRRDAAGRRRLLLRNALWTAWLRRPWGAAWRQTLRLYRAAPGGLAWRAVAEAAAGLPWVLANRRVVPPRVEALCRLLEESAGPD